MMDQELQAKYDEWMKWDKNEKTKAEIESLHKEKKYDELKSRLLSRMEFGTAGLRARMGAGNSMMNDLTIIQTSQGFSDYLKSYFGNVLKEKGVVIGYDARHNSKRFAQLTANIFLHEGVPVRLFRQITPTPFVPFSILRFKCCAGVMVTASHNPKDDNGYKVYFDNGAQIISPHDTGIANAIEKNLEPREYVWQLDKMSQNPLLTDPFDQVYRDYFDELKSICFHRHMNESSSLRFVYTAMHGVGYEFSREAFKSFGLAPFIPVKEQIEPDPEFPTVKFPNPEEGKSALDLAIKTANENNVSIILANDPDADRLAIAEKLTSTGEWKILNGNETATLLGWWIWINYKQKNVDKTPEQLKGVYMLYSTVSSHILKSIAEKEGFSCEDTLTGFKWMGNLAHNLINNNKTVLFSFEEAIGFMCNTKVLDKDGISAEAVAAEMAVYLHQVENRTLNEKLEWIYEHYGFHYSNNSYYLSYDQQNTNKMFHRLRHFNDQTSEEYTYPEKLGPYKINKIRDLTVGITVDFTDNGKRSTPNFPSSKSSHMLTFYFDNGCILTIRTSGTEPKIKWYSEMKQLDKSKTREEIKAELNDLINHMIDEFYQPQVNNLKARQP